MSAVPLRVSRRVRAFVVVAVDCGVGVTGLLPRVIMLLCYVAVG